MRYVEKLESVEPLDRTEKRDARLKQWLSTEIEDAISARTQWDKTVQEALRQYNGVPKHPTRNVPVENAPNIEITLGAIAVDSLYAQTLSFIFSTSPILTINPVNSDWEKHADALQTFVNWGVANEWELYAAAEHTIFDTCQLGTGCYYIPYLEGVLKTVTRRVVERGPKVLTVPIEDFLTPGGAYGDHQKMAWNAVRFYLTKQDLRDRARKPKEETEENPFRWDVKKFKPCAGRDFVRSSRETMGHTFTNAKQNDLYEVYLVYCRFDYDRDGVDEDLLVVFDRTALEVGWVGYTPHAYRPFEIPKYQVRGHLFHGMGPMEMLAPYQDEVTEAHNDRTLNVKLANTRMFAARTGQVDEGTLSAWPGRIIPVASPKEDLVPLQMGEIYPSAGANEQITMTLAERRVGVSQVNQPSQIFGSRTPAFTAGAAIQQQNVRFAPAFENMRRSSAAAVRQCLWRYHEQIMRETTQGTAAQNILQVVGPEKAALIFELLKMDDFEQAVSVELTASSASVNKDMDRQNAMLFAQLIGAYCDRILQLVMVAGNLQAPEVVRETARQIAEVAAEVIKKTATTFDEIRDPERFVIDAAKIIDALPIDPTGLQGLAAQMGLIQAPGTPGPEQNAVSTGPSQTVQ